MPRISDFIVCCLNEQPTLVIDAVVKEADVPFLVGDSYDKIQAYLKSQGEYLTDAPFVAYHNDDLNNLEVEVGFPTRRALMGSGDIRFATVPAGKFVICMHLGPRKTLKAVYEEMEIWLKENSLEVAGIHIYEYYYGSRNEKNEDNLITKVAVPIK